MKDMSEWLVYIVRCADETLYTEITNELTRRIDQHNAGTASRYTCSRLPVVLVYRELQTSRSLALKRELAIKAFYARRMSHWLRLEEAANVENKRIHLEVHSHS